MPARPQAFAVWITGLPASGKSTVASALAAELRGLGIEAAILESDALRPIFMPQGGYDEAGRDLFYRQIAYVGALLVQHGVPVIFDATANRRRSASPCRARSRGSSAAACGRIPNGASITWMTSGLRSQN